MKVTAPRYVNVKRYKRTIGKACLVRGCTRSATVTALRRDRNGFSMEVAYCVDHAEEGGVV